MNCKDLLFELLQQVAYLELYSYEYEDIFIAEAESIYDLAKELLDKVKEVKSK